MAEAAFWAPAALLPSPPVRWEEVDGDTARAIVRYGEFEQAVDITVSEAGAPVRVVIERWSNENPARQFRLQPFGGHLSDYRVRARQIRAVEPEGGARGAAGEREMEAPLP